MKWFRKILRGLQNNLKFSISNPKTFEEVWSVNSNGLRMISLVVVVILLLGIGSGYLISVGFGGYSKENVSIEREQLEEQNKRIEELTNQMSAQESYISKISLILSGEIPLDTPLDSIDLQESMINLDSIDHSATSSEKKLANEVKSDMLTAQDDKENVTYFGSPVKGVISQEYNKKTHKGIDVVTEANAAVKACLSGTVIYAGYTHKDGHILIIEHPNNYISVYKHNKRVLKKIGSKVQLGDPISIVGNTGENSDGPHLHFELWYDQNPVNPADYIRFTR